MTETDYPPQISPAELKERLERGEALALLDVREDSEWAFNRIPGAIHIPMGDVPARLQELPDDRPIVCYCHHGVRSFSVQQYLIQHDFPNALNLAGGIDAWSRDADPSVPVY